MGRGSQICASQLSFSTLSQLDGASQQVAAAHRNHGTEREVSLEPIPSLEAWGNQASAWGRSRVGTSARGNVRAQELLHPGRTPPGPVHVNERTAVAVWSVAKVPYVRCARWPVPKSLKHWGVGRNTSSRESKADSAVTNGLGSTLVGRRADAASGWLAVRYDFRTVPTFRLRAFGYVWLSGLPRLTLITYNHLENRF